MSYIYMMRVRDIRAYLTDKEWEELRKMKIETHSRSWGEFLRKIVDNKDRVLFVLKPPMPP